jgi:hypothetical protein
MTYKTKDSGKRITFNSGMTRDVDDNKPRYDLCYEPLLTEWAHLMARGAVKYGENNWQLSNSTEELQRFKASAWRHFIAFINGENDEAHHAAICFNVGAIMYLRNKGVKE